MVRITIGGKVFTLPKGIPRTRISRNIDEIKEYTVKFDTKKRYSLDSKITRTEYERVKRNYDLRMIKWISGTIPKYTGREQYYISGRNRLSVKNVESERADEIHVHRNYIQIVGDKVHPFNIALMGEKIGSVLYLDTESVSGLPKNKAKQYRQLSLIQK